MKTAIVRAAVIATLALGCNDPTAGPQLKGEVGSYGLQTVNGLVLPYLANQNGTFKAEITSGSLDLRNDASFTESRISRITQAGGVSSLEGIASGTYTRNGTQLVFTIPPTGGGQAVTYQGIVSANSVSVTSQGFTYVYNKR